MGENPSTSPQNGPIWGEIPPNAPLPIPTRAPLSPAASVNPMDALTPFGDPTKTRVETLGDPKYPKISFFFGGSGVLTGDFHLLAPPSSGPALENGPRILERRAHQDPTGLGYFGGERVGFFWGEKIGFWVFFVPVLTRRRRGCRIGPRSARKPPRGPRGRRSPCPRRCRGRGRRTELGGGHMGVI